jgi:hypothetical protein
MNAPQQLLILARVTHYEYQGRFYSYTPYAREIEVWADLFSEVVVAGTLRHEAPPADCTMFAHPNIKVVPVFEAGGDGVKAKVLQLFCLPLILGQLFYYMLMADAIQIRCPADLGLLGAIFGPLFSRNLVAKYATQWLPFANEPLAWRFQRWLLKSRWWGGPVTVYGEWPNQPPNVIPFFNSMLTDSDVERAKLASCRPKATEVLRVLFVGRLSQAKNVHTLLHAVAQAETPVRRIDCTIVGEGPERSALEQLAVNLGIADRVHFAGGLSFADVLCHYERAEALVLASDIEGWPKVIAEGMAFGLVCVGSTRGLMPQMLGDKRGYLVPPRDIAALRAALEQIAAHPGESAMMGAQAAAWAQRFTIEKLRENFRQILIKHWGINERNWTAQTAAPNFKPV